MSRVAPPKHYTAQELRIWQDGFVAGRTFQLELDLERLPDVQEDAPDVPEDAPEMAKLSSSQVLERMNAEGGRFDFERDPDDWE